MRPRCLPIVLALSGCTDAERERERDCGAGPNEAPTVVGDISPPPGEIAYDPARDSAVIEITLPGLADANACDRLYWRAFINYSPPSGGIWEQSAAEGVAPEDRARPVRLRLNPCAELDDRALGPNIEVDVTDRPFADDQGLESPHRAVAEGAGLLRLAWSLRFEGSCR